MKQKLLAAVAAAMLTAMGFAQESAHTITIRAALEKRECPAIVDAVNAGIAVNDPEAMYQAARLFDGLGCVAADKNRALSLYEKAADAGHAAAAGKLGTKHGLGEGVAQGYAQAAAWFRKAMPQALQSVPAELDYSVGYTMTLAQLTRERWRASADDIDQSGVSAAVVKFNPATGKLTVDFERRPLFTSGSATSAARRAVWVALTEAWESAQKAAPAPEKSRLGAIELNARIDIEAPARDRAAGRGPAPTVPMGGSKY